MTSDHLPYSLTLYPSVLNRYKSPNVPIIFYENGLPLSFECINNDTVYCAPNTMYKRDNKSNSTKSSKSPKEKTIDSTHFALDILYLNRNQNKLNTKLLYYINP